MKLMNKKPKPLTNFEIQKYSLNEPRLMVFIVEVIYLTVVPLSATPLKLKDGADVINLVINLM